MSIEVSVVICTHNRAPYLRRALSSLRDQTLSSERFEILVIDNASTDDTQNVVENEFSALENLRRVDEPTLGLGRARNTGWQQARGRYIAFLDDDAIANPDWLARIIDCFATVSPEPGMVGGRVDPIWEAPRPEWLSDELARALTIVDWPVEAPSRLAKNQWVSAANLVLPRSVLEEIGGCCTDLGRQGDCLLSNEENLLRLQIEDLGRDCYYHPEIRVAHHAHVARLTQAWFKKRLHWQGVSQARTERLYRSRGWLSSGLGGLKAFVRMGISMRFLKTLSRQTVDPEEFKKQCLAHYRVGYATGLVGIERWVSTK